SRVSVLPEGRSRTGTPGTAHRESGVSRVRCLRGPPARQSATCECADTMNTSLRAVSAVVLASSLLLSGCETLRRPQPYDYTNFRAHPPRSILVLPPLNESTTIEGTYGYLSTVTRPIAERGYYVFPVAVTDQFMKDNGLPTAGEMQDAPLAKFAEVIGAD